MRNTQPNTYKVEKIALDLNLKKLNQYHQNNSFDDVSKTLHNIPQGINGFDQGRIVNQSPLTYRQQTQNEMNHQQNSSNYQNPTYYPIFPNKVQNPPNNHRFHNDIPLPKSPVTFTGSPMSDHTNIMNSLNLVVKMMINHCDEIFDRHDANRSGFLDIVEIVPAVTEIFTINKKPIPKSSDILTIMRKFDGDGNGLIDKKEFRLLVLTISGLL